MQFLRRMLREFWQALRGTRATVNPAVNAGATAVTSPAVVEIKPANAHPEAATTGLNNEAASESSLEKIKRALSNWYKEDPSRRTIGSLIEEFAAAIHRALDPEESITKITIEHPMLMPEAITNVDKGKYLLASISTNLRNCVFSVYQTDAGIVCLANEEFTDTVVTILEAPSEEAKTEKPARATVAPTPSPPPAPRGKHPAAFFKEADLSLPGMVIGDATKTGLPPLAAMATGLRYAPTRVSGIAGAGQTARRKVPTLSSTTSISLSPTSIGLGHNSRG